MKYQKIVEAWEELKRLIMPPNAPVNQIIDMKKSFYCGVSWVLNIIHNISVSSEEEGDKEAQYIVKLNEEMDIFIRKIKESQS